MDITGSLSENEAEEGDQTEEGDDETAGNEGSRAVELLLGDRTGCPVQQAATSRISSEATHILDNTLTKSEDQLVLEGKKAAETKETPELIPAAFTDAGLENLRKEVNEANRSRPMPKPISGGGFNKDRHQPSNPWRARIQVNILLPELLIYLIRGIDKPLKVNLKISPKPKTLN